MAQYISVFQISASQEASKTGKRQPRHKPSLPDVEKDFRQSKTEICLKLG